MIGPEKKSESQIEKGRNESTFQVAVPFTPAVIYVRVNSFRMALVPN